VGPLGEGFLPDRVKQRAIHDLTAFDRLVKLNAANA